MAYDSVHNQIVLFGGYYESTTGHDIALLKDTWAWGGAKWTQMFPQNSPPAGAPQSIVYDSVRRQVVLFDANFSAWIWDGTNWTQNIPQTTPPSGQPSIMAYDPSRGQEVLLDGSETWVWDGVNWTQVSSIGPPPRGAGAMAYDVAHSQMILFGGVQGNFFGGVSPLGDTWLWNDSKWTQQFPATNPAPRSDAGMTYDPAHSALIMFGGLPTTDPTSATGVTADNDTWIWDGSNWILKSPQNRPPESSDFATAFDPVSDQTLLFGGLTADQPGFVSSSSLDTFWAYTPGGVTKPVISNAGILPDFGGLPNAAPGSWIEIDGSSLAYDSLAWSTADFIDGSAPTSLHGIQVTVGSQRAFVEYISPTQVNVQLPFGISSGLTPISVIGKYATSDPFYLNINATAPGLLAPSSFDINGNQYVVGLLVAGTYVLPAGSIPGTTSRPAQAGETIILFGVGFGPVIPESDAGVIETELNQLATPLEVFFGDVQAQISYAGLTPGNVGLYQFNVVVPSLSAGDLVPLTFRLGGLSGAQTLFTAIGSSN